MGAPVKEGELLAGKYRVERVLAEGGMGVVVAAIHQQLEQRVALKFLLPEGMGNEQSVARFLREARAAVRLRSEHVARVLDVGTAEDGAPYIVMEYLEGNDLSNLLAEEKRLPVETAVTYVLQACEAIAEAHALGIVHRDLKPANLFLTRRADGTPCVKVLDFGISKAVGNGLNFTQTQSIVGTPYYMAPELLRSSKEASPRSDIYALGMILYELLAGEVAWRRDTLPELCVAIMNDPLPPLRPMRDDVPPALEAILEKTLAKAAEARYQTLAELASALEPFSHGGVASKVRIHRILGVMSKPDGAPVPAPSTVQGVPPLAPSKREETTRFVPEPSAQVFTSPSQRMDQATPDPRAILFAPSTETPVETRATTTPERPKHLLGFVLAGFAVMAACGTAGIVLALRSNAAKATISSPASTAPVASASELPASARAPTASATVAATTEEAPAASAPTATTAPTQTPTTPAQTAALTRPLPSTSARPGAILPPKKAPQPAADIDLGPRK